MTLTLLLSLAFDALVVIAILGIRKRRMHSRMSIRVTDLMRSLQVPEPAAQPAAEQIIGQTRATSEAQAA